MYIMLCNIGWLKYYQGCDVDGEYDKPLNGGSWNDENIGWESLNFYDYDGHCYGCFSLPNSGETLHLKANFDLLNDAKELDGVTVIFVADAKGSPLKYGRRIIGWYKNATAYRDLQEYDGSGEYFRIKAKAEDCTLLPEDERHFIVQHVFRNILYYNQDRDDEFQEYLNYINGYVNSRFMDNTESVYTEGVSKHLLLEQKTRNHIVVQKAKEQHKQKNGGSLPCEVCGFDFVAVYGELGEGFIEAHHIKPHAERGKRKIRIRDFALVCPNCHRMLHRDGNLTVEELKSIIDASLPF